MREPRGKGYEATRQDRRLNAHALQRPNQLPRSLRRRDDILQLRKDIRVYALQQAHALAERGGEVQLAVHGAGGDFRYGGLGADGRGDEVDDFLLDERAVHVEDDQARVPPQHAVTLQDHVDVPLALEAVQQLMFPQVGQGDVRRVGGGGEGKFHDGGVQRGVEAAVRGCEGAGAGRGGEGGDQVEKGCQA